MNVTIEKGKFVCNRICVNFFAKLQMANEAVAKGYLVEFTADGIDVYEKITKVQS